MSFLKGKYALLLTVVLLLQAAVYYAAAARREQIPNFSPLATFPATIGDWRQIADRPLAAETEQVLRADDTLDRTYAKPALIANHVSQAEVASLWIAYYKTQRYAQTPHSPKACLPGSGWEEIESGTIPIVVPGVAQPIAASKYVVKYVEANGDSQKLVAIYWYQSHRRVISSEYAARYWLVLDSIRYHRSDTSLVRATVDVRHDDLEAATRTAVSFVQAFFPALMQQFPM